MTVMFDVAAEQIVIGRCLFSINAVDLAVESLATSDFYQPQHHIIFEAIKSLRDRDCVVEPFSVAGEIAKKGDPKFDSNYLMGFGTFKTGDEIDPFIQIIKNASQQRALLRILSEQLSLVQAKPRNCENIFHDIQTKLDHVFVMSARSRECTLAECYQADYRESGKNYIEWLKEQKRKNECGDRTLTGLATNYKLFDETLDGLNKGHYIIVGARPGVGKTTFILNIIYKLLLQDVKVAFFSLEMSHEEVIHKMTCISAGVNSKDATQGAISKQDIIEMEFATKILSSKLLFIDDQSELRVSQMRSRIRRMIAAYGIQIIFVDYLSELKPDGNFPNRQEAMQSVSKALRAIAKDTGLPIVCIAQLNREQEKTGRIPQKSDLRESGQIEQDAHSIILLHRPEEVEANGSPSKIRAHIAKNRFGEEKIIDFNFHKKTGQLDEMLPLREEHKIIANKNAFSQGGIYR